MSERSDRRFGGDLGLVVVGTLLAGILLLGPDTLQPLEVLAGVGLLVVFPGYALVSLSFPSRPATVESTTGPISKGTVGWPARVALTVLLSGLVVAGTALGLNWTVGIRLAPAVAVITVVTLLAAGLALVRRRQVPVANQVRLPSITETVRAARTNTRQSGALFLALAVLAATVVVVGVVPVGGEAYTEVALLSETEDGSLVAEGYPEAVSADGTVPVTLELTNHEFRSVEYDVVALAAPITADGTVGDPVQIDAFERELAHGEAAVVDRSLQVPSEGDRIRITMVVFEGEAPESLADPDHRVQFSVDQN